MHHSLTRHRNFSVLSNYLGITANESRSSFAECRRLFLLHRVYFVYTRTYIKIYTSVRTRTRNVSTLRSRRRRHLAVLTNCPPVLFPSRPGIRRIAFQQLLNTPATRGRQVGWGGGGESGQSANRFLRPTLSYPWRACPSAGGRAVDVSLRRDRGRFSLNLASRWTRAYLNEPATIEITKPRFCTEPDTTRFLRC